MSRSAFVCLVFLWTSLAVIAAAPARGDVTVEPPILDLAASQLEAKTGDLVTVTVLSGSVQVETTVRCTPGATVNDTPVCGLERNETFLPSPGPVSLWAVRANGVRLELVEGDAVNLTSGTASAAFRVTNEFGFDVLRVEARDETTGAVAVPLWIKLVFSEHLRYEMWRDALRQIDDRGAAAIAAGEANRNAWTGFTIAGFVFLDAVVLLLAAHRLARARRGMSWIDRVRLALPLRVHVDPTKYAMDEKDTWSPDIPAEARKQRILFDATLRRRAIVDALEELRGLLGAESGAAAELVRLDHVIREARERFGLPAASERRGRLRSLDGGA